MRIIKRVCVNDGWIVTVGLLVFVWAPNFSYSQSDQERQQQLIEKRKKEIGMIEALREKYPDSWRDSLEVRRAKSRYEEAMKRLDMYRNHPRKDTLREIDLSYAQLEEVPDFVFEADSLRMLVLDWNKIRKLPKELGRLDSLKKVYWRNNDFQGKRPKIQKISQLEKLSMDGCQLSRAPQFKRLTGLKTLELKKNKFETIPINQIRKNRKLESLAIGENPMRLSEAKYGKIDFLKVLKVNKSNLTGFDPSIYDLVNLDEWQLQENRLKSLPEGISRMKSLTKFSCYKNQLEELPKDFFDLERLRVVDLYYNKLEVIPKEVKRLDSLEILYLSHNKVYGVPKELGELPRLRELYLHTNRISVLPSTLSNLDSLRVIRVNDNYLIDFPESILDMASIREVDVNNNDLTTLPAEIEGLDKLTLFSFQNNEIDLQTEENAHVPYMIERMLQRGVICLPEIYRREVGSGN